MRSPEKLPSSLVPREKTESWGKNSHLRLFPILICFSHWLNTWWPPPKTFWHRGSPYLGKFFNFFLLENLRIFPWGENTSPYFIYRKYLKFNLWLSQAPVNLKHKILPSINDQYKPTKDAHHLREPEHRGSQEGRFEFPALINPPKRNRNSQNSTCK